MTATVKMVWLSFAACFALGAMAEAPEISGVMVRQRWPWSRLVDIDYVLAREATQRVDITVEAYDGSAPLALPPCSLSGDLYNVNVGSRRIVWDPAVTTYTNAGVISKFRVELTPAPVPLYMIVDLTNAVGTQAHVEYVYEADLRAGKWGSWVENPVTNAGTPVSSLVWTGVATNDIYKTDKLVLRRVPAGTFTMGSPEDEPARYPERETQHVVELTKDFYVGVFEVTQEQWKKVMGSYNAYTWFGAMFPVEHVSYDTIRGATNNMPPVDWPGTGSFVSPTNFLGKLRVNTGFADFDLPTEAQWEYACRAGTTTIYNDGNTNAPNDGMSEVPSASNLFMNALGWYKYNSGGKTHIVGQKTPNAWGLYDMHGNIVEWTRDWYVDFTDIAVTDPPGGTASPLGFRAARGGSWYHDAAAGRTAMRHRSPPMTVGNTYGFRIVRHLP